MRQLELEKLFAVAQDAEVGLTGRGGRKGFSGQEVITEKTGAKKFGAAGANTVMLDAANEAVGICHRQAGPPEKSMEEKGFLEEPTWAARAVRVERCLLSPHEPKKQAASLRQQWQDHCPEQRASQATQIIKAFEQPF